MNNTEINEQFSAMIEVLPEDLDKDLLLALMRVAYLHGFTSATHELTEKLNIMVLNLSFGDDSNGNRI